MTVEYHPIKLDAPSSMSLRAFATKYSGELSKDDAKKLLKKNQEKMRKLQVRLHAEDKQSLLVVFQAMDTGGKDSTIEKVVGHLNPQGCAVHGFKKPTDEELAHDFLWRVHPHTPAAGQISIFNRSHYEDVLIVKVHQWAADRVIDQRYEQINQFENLLHSAGTRIVKIMLHISSEYQRERLIRRLEKPSKQWKFNPADLVEREHWDAYTSAYETMLSRCSTSMAPWYIVPAETRWYRNVIVSQILRDTLEEMDPQFPDANFDPDDYKIDSLS